MTGMRPLSRVNRQPCPPGCPCYHRGRADGLENFFIEPLPNQLNNVFETPSSSFGPPSYARTQEPQVLWLHHVY